MEKISKTGKTFVWAAFALFALYAVTLILPMVWILINSFKGYQEWMFGGNIWGWPKNFTLSNWKEAFTLEVNGVTLPLMFVNSVIMIVGCTAISIACSAATAYCLSKYRFPGSRAMYSVAIVMMLIPSLGNLASVYKLVTDIKLYDTFWCLFLFSTSGFGTGFVLLYGFFKNLSWSYAEAAFVDGAGHFTVLFKIMMPMALPGIGAVSIFNIIGLWNDYFTIYMYAPSKITVAFGLTGFLNKAESSGNFPRLFAILLLTLVPIILIFCVFQKTLMQNTAMGGLKG
jgi:raffinose/stachyose/melibiose transport system permease protein/N-acetylglucosamine transport system permease protein